MTWFEHGESRIYYEEEGSGQPVLVLPGWGGSISEFEGLREALASRYRVIAADLPGSGRSGPQPRVYSPDYYQEDARAFVQLLEGLAASPAHLFGFSDGGEYALLIAAERPDLVRSVVAVGAAGKAAEPAPGMLDAFDILIDHPIEPLKELSSHMSAAYGTDNARVMARSFANAMKGIIAGGGDISRSRAGEISCPVLLIAGENDMFISPALASETAAAIPQGRHIEVAGAGHDVHSSHGDWLAATVLDWLATVSVATTRR